MRLEAIHLREVLEPEGPKELSRRSIRARPATRTQDGKVIEPGIVLEDEPATRRIWIRLEGAEARWVPYEMVRGAVMVAELKKR